MADVVLDTSQLDKLAADLRAGGKGVARDVSKVLAVSALNIKRDWQRRWRGHPAVPAIPNAINYDIRVRLHSIEAEIGVDKGRRQGPLGNLLEFGSVHNAPLPGGAPALAAEAPKLEAAAAKYVGDLLK